MQGIRIPSILSLSLSVDLLTLSSRIWHPHPRLYRFQTKKLRLANFNCDCDCRQRRQRQRRRRQRLRLFGMIITIICNSDHKSFHSAGNFKRNPICRRSCSFAFVFSFCCVFISFVFCFFLSSYAKKNRYI